MTFDMERPGAGADCTRLLPWTRPLIEVPPRSAFVNTGPEHMPAGPSDHLDHLRRLAMRGEKDES